MLLILVLSFLAVITAVAQDEFPDVPANHWAYTEVASGRSAPNFVEVIQAQINYCWDSPAIRQGFFVASAILLLMISLTTLSRKRTQP